MPLQPHRSINLLRTEASTWPDCTLSEAVKMAQAAETVGTSDTASATEEVHEATALQTHTQTHAAGMAPGLANIQPTAQSYGPPVEEGPPASVWRLRLVQVECDERHLATLLKVHRGEFVRSS